MSTIHVFLIKLQLIRNLTKCLVYPFQHLIRWGFSLGSNRNPKFEIKLRRDFNQGTDYSRQILNLDFREVRFGVTCPWWLPHTNLDKGRRLMDLPK